MGQVIHARWADGTGITGVEVFREMWEAIGLRALARLARRPTNNKLLVRASDWFARNRLRLTGFFERIATAFIRKPVPFEGTPLSTQSYQDRGRYTR